jgi:molecular chaperone GrpE (heat shock protein)
MPSHPSHPSHRTRAQERIDAIDVSPTKLLAEIERLKGEAQAVGAQAEAARAQADEYLTALQRERAEFLNFKRRTSEEREAMYGVAAEGASATSASRPRI